MPFGIKDYHKTLNEIHVGCEEPRAYFVPYHSRESAKEGIRDYSNRFKTLIGCWNFKYYNSVREVPNIMSEAVQFSEKLDVPMNWQHAIGRKYDKMSMTACTPMRSKVCTAHGVSSRSRSDKARSPCSAPS